MITRNHVVITGTGRAGTTFLVELLTHLGLETGFSADDFKPLKYYEEARAGLEYSVRRNDCPFIVKDPRFCDYVEEVIHRDDIVIEHVFIPIRDLHAAAESRRYVTRTIVSKLPFYLRLKNLIRSSRFPGGLLHIHSIKPGKQEEVLLKQVYKVMLALSDTTIRVTFMRYPRIVKDCPYLFDKLKPVLQNVTYESFCAAFDKVVRPELVHSFNENDC